MNGWAKLNKIKELFIDIIHIYKIIPCFPFVEMCGLAKNKANDYFSAIEHKVMLESHICD